MAAMTTPTPPTGAPPMEPEPLPGFPSPRNIEELKDPAFIAHLRERFPEGSVEPDDQDYDLTAQPATTEERAHEYRLAQTRKVKRLYREWKAKQN